MSTTGAVKQRDEMISTYKSMLKGETNPVRIQAIEDAIKLTESELEDVKKLGGKLFGKKQPLRQEVTIIETDKDSQTIKVTRIPKDPKQQTEVEITQDGRLIAPKPQTESSTEDTKSNKKSSGPKASDNKVDNKLRSTLQKEAKQAAEESIQAKIAAAKAAKKKENN